MLESEVIEQGLQHGTVFKFNKRKYSNALRYDLAALEFECSKDGMLSNDYWLDSKTYKFTSRFDGQNVCFVYSTAKDYYSV